MSLLSPTKATISKLKLRREARREIIGSGPHWLPQNVKLAYQKTGKREPPVADQGNKQVLVETERERSQAGNVKESGPHWLPQNVILTEPYTYLPAHSVVLVFFLSLMLIVSKFKKVKVSS